MAKAFLFPGNQVVDHLQRSLDSQKLCLQISVETVGLPEVLVAKNYNIIGFPETLLTNIAITFGLPGILVDDIRDES